MRPPQAPPVGSSGQPWNCPAVKRGSTGRATQWAAACLLFIGPGLQERAGHQPSCSTPHRAAPPSPPAHPANLQPGAAAAAGVQRTQPASIHIRKQSHVGPKGAVRPQHLSCGAAGQQGGCGGNCSGIGAAARWCLLAFLWPASPASACSVCSTQQQLRRWQQRQQAPLAAPRLNEWPGTAACP